MVQRVVLDSGFRMIDRLTHFKHSLKTSHFKMFSSGLLHYLLKYNEYLIALVVEEFELQKN